MTMSFGRLFMSLGGMLVAFIVFAPAMMLRSSTMRLRGILVMLGSPGVSFLRHLRSVAE
jgi:hypothetical protein